MIAMVFLIFWVTGSTLSPLNVVLISFLPAILTILLTFFILERYGKRYLPFVVVIPISLCAVLYAAHEHLGNVEIENIILLNLLISGIFILILNSIRRTSVIR
jgi:hypothetical protein